jgi:hypothetical protein
VGCSFCAGHIGKGLGYIAKGLGHLISIPELETTERNGSHNSDT